MADSIRVSLPTSGDEAEMGAAPDDPLPTPGPGGGAGGGGEDVHQAQQPLRQHSSQHSGSSSHGHGHGGHRPQKRRRIPVACGACRSKKSRCDGFRPKCSSCQAQNIECIYLSPPISATTPVPRAFLQLVESRLSQLESDVRSLKTQSGDHGGGGGPVGYHPMVMDRRDSLASYAFSTSVAEPEAEDYVLSPDATDGMGSIEFTKEDDSGYYGPTSNIAFTRNIRRALYALLSRPNHAHHGADASKTGNGLDIPHRPSLDVSRPTTPLGAHASRPGGHGHAQVPAPGDFPPLGGLGAPGVGGGGEQHVGGGGLEGESPDLWYLRLPPEEEMDALVARFFADTGALFPFVHGPSFVETYRRVKGLGFRRFRRSWLGLLNAIMAMATVTSPSSARAVGGGGGGGDGVGGNGVSGGGGVVSAAAERAAAAEVFYERAKALCLEQMLHGASLETVQAMLLMSQYLQGTHRSTTTWNIHGLAVKAAFQLGLHTTSSSSYQSPLDREMRLRTWYGCIILDRTLSMTFGRPPAIPNSYIRTPLPTQSEDINGIIHQKGENSLLSTDFFVYTITLYKIMWTVIDVLYECNLGPPDGGVLPVASSTLQIEHQLLEWQATLGGPLSSLVTPAELQRDDDFGGDNDLAPHEQQGQGQHFSSSPERRFRVILTLRYHNVRILAHRRMLDLYLASLERGLGSYDAEDSMLRQVGQRSKSICFQSASDLIAIVGVLTRSKEPKRGLLGAWWFTLYYTFNATLTIVALLLCTVSSGGDPGSGSSYEAIVTSGQALRDVLAEALACLPLIDTGNKMVEKCAQFAETLNHCLHLLENPNSCDASGNEENLQMIETPRASHYAGPHSYAPIQVDASHFDLGAMGWDESFFSSIRGGMTDGFQETDLFC